MIARSAKISVQAEELPSLAAEVRKEYDGLRLSTVATLKLFQAEGARALLRNQFVISLNVHARNLLAFFTCSPKAHPEDVLATHYTSEWNPKHHGGVDLAYLQSAFLPGVNKRLAHISARRIRSEPADDAVPVAEIYSSIAGLMERFLALLEPNKHAWFCRDGSPPDTSSSALFLKLR